MLQGLRNKVAFHFDVQTAELAMDSIQSNQELVDFHSTTYGNAFYGSGAILTAFQLVAVAGVNEGQDKFDILLDEIGMAVHWFETYAASYLIVSAQHYMGGSIEKMGRDVISFDAPNILAAYVPYFMDDDGISVNDFI